MAAVAAGGDRQIDWSMGRDSEQKRTNARATAVLEMLVREEP